MLYDVRCQMEEGGKRGLPFLNLDFIMRVVDTSPPHFYRYIICVLLFSKWICCCLYICLMHCVNNHLYIVIAIFVKAIHVILA